MTYKFKLTKEQEIKYDAWLKRIPKLPSGQFGSTGGGYWFKFIPNGLGTIVTAGRDDGYEINLTEYEDF